MIRIVHGNVQDHVGDCLFLDQIGRLGQQGAQIRVRRKSDEVANRRFPARESCPGCGSVVIGAF